mmetsp:Transcript_88233/g.175298  ORF Transcript_88233/g.175298 Transcript_88233/m.175298 type:complete len:202 (-) Transcript_88233:83-688(-)
MATPGADTIGFKETEDPNSVALPAGVKGSMDGERPPMTQVEEIKKAFEPYREKYGHYLTQIRPWREFLYLTKPDGDMQKRLQVNLTHYQINYAVVMLLNMVVAIVMNPKCLIVMCVLALGWVAFLRKNDDPNWEVNVGGMPLGKTQRWMVLSVVTAVVLLVFVGQVLFSAAAFCAVLVLAHAIMHPIPEIVATNSEVEEMV